MKTNRRRFLATALAGGAAAALPLSSPAAAARSTESVKANYAKLDEILKQPVLKRQFFTSPVMIETLELLRLGNSFLCRVRSKDGAEGISVSNNSQQISLAAIQVNRLQPFFIGKDARDLDNLLGGLRLPKQLQAAEPRALGSPRDDRVCHPRHARPHR